MPIPDYRDITLPALKFFSDGKREKPRLTTYQPSRLPNNL